MISLDKASSLEIQRELLGRALVRTEAALLRAQATLAALQAKGRAQAKEMVRLCDRIAAEREIAATVCRMKPKPAMRHVRKNAHRRMGGAS